PLVGFQVQTPSAIAGIVADKFAVLVDDTLVGAIAKEYSFQVRNVLKTVIDVSGSRGRFAVVLRQRHGTVAAARGLGLGPVVDLDWRQLGLHWVEGKKTIAIDGVAAVLLVDPAIVEEDALAIAIVENFVPALRAKVALFGGVGAGLIGCVF